MNNTTRLVATLGLLTATAAFGGSSNAGTVQTYAGDPYIGRVDVRILIPGKASEQRDSGTGSAYFTKTDNGQTRLVVSGSIRKDSDTGFVVDGSESKSGWSSRDSSLSIGKDGQITGSSVEHPNRYRFNGVLSEGKFDLKVEHELLAGSKQGLPPRTKFVFSYDLRREAGTKDASAPGSEKKTVGDRRCKRTIWQMRNVANMGGGPMIMVRVPQCVSW
jgi:hypothetical protein